MADDSDIDQLTQFRPLSPPADRATNSVTDFFMRWFGNENETAPSPTATYSPAKSPVPPAIPPPTSTSASASTSTPSSPYMATRSLSIVTSRISNLLTRNSSNAGSSSNLSTASSTSDSTDKRQRPLKDYNSSDFRQYWMPDSRGKECFECQEKFTTFRRRHHCRICGQIFCSRCCKQEIPGRLLGYVGDLRLCNYCCRVVLQYLNSPAGERALHRGGHRDSESDVVQLRENLLRTLADSTPKSSNIQIQVDEVNVEDGGDSDEDLFDALLTPRKISTATEAWSTPTGGHLTTGRHRENSISSSASDPQPVFGLETTNQVGNSSVSKTSLFKSSSTDALNVDDESTPLDTENEEPDWVKLIETREDIADKRLQAEKAARESAEPVQVFEAIDSTSASGPAGPIPRPTTLATKRHSIRRKSVSLDIFQREETPTYRKSSKRGLGLSASRSFASTSPVFSKFRSASSDKLSSNFQNRQAPSNVHYGPLHKAFEQEAQKVLECLLRRANVNVARWKPVLWPLTQEIAFSVQPQVRQRKDDMDALRYVHIKTLQSSLIPGAQVIFGTVCTKSVADKRMTKSFTHPSIFVVGGSIEYERVGGKFCPIDPIIMQEKEYLLSLVRKVAALKPQVLVVEKSVARVAQEYFRQAGISLVFNMKSAALRRIARSVEAGVAPSVEDQLIKPRMGRCGSFRTESYTILDTSGSKTSSAKSKTLMFFEDCPPDLGCAIILAGPDVKELQLVKKVTKFMIGAAYSSKLEIEFLRAYQACIDAETTLERPLAAEESCLICARNDELSVESNDCSKEPDELAEGLEKLRRTFVNRVFETSFTFSSFLGVQLPYLQTLSGSRCVLRPFFNMDRLYRSIQNENGQVANSETESPRRSPSRSDEYKENEQVMDQVFEHQFVRTKLTNSADSVDVRGKLARFRAQSAKLLRKKLEAEKRRKEAEKRKSMLENDERDDDSQGASGAIDVLDPFLHRRIAVLYSSYSPKSDNAPGFCLKPRVFVMHFYGRFDVTLGDYLERYCFDSNYECANEACEASMVTHVRKLVHGNCCVEITTQNIDVPNTGNDSTKASTDLVEQHILCWNWCVICKMRTPATPMNSEFWHLSFARFLEYLVNGKRLGSFTVRDVPCSHCLFHQLEHYFAFRNSVVSFKCSSITLYDVSFPPAVCTWKPDQTKAMTLVEDTMRLSERAGEIFSHMVEVLCGLKSLVPLETPSVTSTPTSISAIAQSVVDLQRLHEVEQEAFRTRLSSAQALLPGFRSEDQLKTNQEDYLTIVNSHTVSKHILARCIQQWNVLIAEMINTLKKKQPGEESRSNLSKMMALVDEATVERAILNTVSPPMSVSPASTAVVDRSTVTSPPTDDAQNAAKRTSTDPNDKKQVIKILSMANLQSPFDPSDHYGILPNTDRTPIIMRDNEISSIAAFALCSDEYENQRKVMREAWSSEGVALNLGTATSTEETDGSTANDQDDSSTSLAHQQHIELQFADGSSRFYCKIYYAEKFRLLRKLIFPDGEEVYARSLARCKPWQPKGGKSGANFYISHDKRFILKQLSRFEVQSLLKFAPNYFQFVASASTENKLSALAKIFGVYRISFRNLQTNSATKLDLLVMEYVFYNRNISQMYDLKGSFRNRFASEKRQADLVLLDENLLKTICSNPFYLNPHSKSALNVAINNDSEVLAMNSIMDYSLLVGVDEEKRELVLGIIDFMRTFTWDKKVESWVKSVSVTGQLPTVISPDLYRDRFVEIMDIYFPVAPDQWTGLV